MPSRTRSSGLAAVFGIAMLGWSLAKAPAAAARGFKQVNLVADTAGMAGHTDPNLLNAWGMTFDRTQKGPLTVADNHAGVVTAYDPTGQPAGTPVTIPAAGGAMGAPTGVVFNGTADFHGDTFISVSEDGIIAGWRAGAPAVVEADNSAAAAVYKGVALGSSSMGNFLYATNFHAGTVDVFDKDFRAARLPGSFTDPKAPVGFAPFGIHNIHGRLYVTFAMQDADRQDDVKGAGHGFIDIFDTDGHLLRRFASGTAAGGRLAVLDSPWGMALAPRRFGRFGRTLLVGNFGSGHIVAFDRRTGHPKGLLRDSAGSPLTLDGLWEVLFGGGGSAGDPHKLYFTSGPDDENHGLLGSLEVARGGAPTRYVHRTGARS
jgi:uncharacterized protein (TIGR03118 family)